MTTLTKDSSNNQGDQAGPITTQTIPDYPGSHPIWGTGRDFAQDPIAILLHIVKDYPQMVRLRFGPFHAHVISDPDLAKEVMVTKNRNFVRPDNLRNILGAASGVNLFNSDGDYWLRQRRMLQPAFHMRRITGFAQTMTTESERLLARWDAHPDVAAGRPVDIQDEMTWVTLNIVGKSLFGVDMQEAGWGQELTGAFGTNAAWIDHRFNNLISAPLWMPTRLNRDFKRGRATVYRLLGEMIDQRRQTIQSQHEERDDFLQMLLELRYEDTDEGMTDKQLMDECGAFFFAGHETTALSLSWAWYLLATHPGAEAKLHAEVDEVLGGRIPTLGDLEQMPYSRMVIEEAMRLYPAAWATSRQSVEAEQIGPYALPAKSMVMINFSGIHRHPDYWERPDSFEPERFSPERSANRPRHAYLPFGQGPRLCIGNQFAMMEAQLVLATVAQRYRMRTLPGYTAKAKPVFTLHVDGGLPMILERR